MKSNKKTESLNKKLGLNVEFQQQMDVALLKKEKELIEAFIQILKQKNPEKHIYSLESAVRGVKFQLDVLKDPSYRISRNEEMLTELIFIKKPKNTILEYDKKLNELDDESKESFIKYLSEKIRSTGIMNLITEKINPREDIYYEQINKEYDRNILAPQLATIDWIDEKVLAFKKIKEKLKIDATSKNHGFEWKKAPSQLVDLCNLLKGARFINSKTKQIDFNRVFNEGIVEKPLDWKSTKPKGGLGEIILFLVLISDFIGYKNDSEITNKIPHLFLINGQKVDAKIGTIKSQYSQIKAYDSDFKIGVKRKDHLLKIVRFLKK